MSDYDLLREFVPGAKPKEQEQHHDGDGHDHLAVARAIQHGRPETLGASATNHLQRLAGNAATTALVAQREEDPGSDPVRQVIGSGGGSALDENTRKTMESKFGQDFSTVRVHTGGAADTAAKSVQAHAFTAGEDIVFGSTKSPSDQRTLAHELTHVVQQRSGEVPGESVGNGLKLSDPGDWAEREAEATADSIVSGDHASHDNATASTGANVQREEKKPDEDELPDDVQMLSMQREEKKPDEDELPDDVQMLSMQREDDAALEDDDEMKNA